MLGLSALHVSHSSVFPNRQWMVSWPPLSMTAAGEISTVGLLMTIAVIQTLIFIDY